jgi:hypothetical protein
MFEQETRGGSTPWNGLARKTLRHLPRHRSSIAQNDQSHARLVPLEGCSASEAAQLHSERMFPSMTAYQYCPTNCLSDFFDKSSYLLNAGNCCMLLWWDIIRRVT